MTAALSPELAIAYVRELSADVRAAIVLDATGRRLAGLEALEAPARSLLGAMQHHEIAHRTPRGVVFAARTPTHALIALAGPLTLIGPTATDVRTATRAIEPTPSTPSAGAQAAEPESVERAAEALFSALDRAI